MADRTMEFGDIELYQAVKKAKTRLAKILTDMQNTVRVSPTAIQMCQRFRDCLRVTEEIDESRLPLLSETATSKQHKKIHCVMCLISWTIQQYWKLADGGKGFVAEIELCLATLEFITDLGLKEFKIAGDISKGYYLEKK